MFNLYEEVKSLFRISGESFEMFGFLKSTMAYTTGDVLYIYESKKEVEEDFYRCIEMLGPICYNTKRRAVFFRESTTIFFKSIDECKKLDGYRFREIEFR